MYNPHDQILASIRLAKKVELTTFETRTLIKALCDELWRKVHSGTRAEHVQLALRLVELCRTLPEDDAA